MSNLGKYFPSQPVSDLLKYQRFGVKETLVASGGTVTTSGGYKIHTFNSTGVDQYFYVLSGIVTLEIFIWGAGGGGANAEGYSDSGGPGGYAYGMLNVQTGNNFVVQVGSGGGRSTSSSRPARPYPNAGLPSIRSGYISGAGGGRSGIFKDSVTHGNSIIIAGGGGGAGGHGGGASFAAFGTHGGGGGGTTGGNGRIYNGGETSGGAGQSSGGAFQSGSGNGGSGALRGADAGDGQVWSASWNAAGGGGDGYYGGGAQEAHVGGGGGSGYLNQLIFNGSLERTTLGTSKLSSTVPPQTGNQYYSSGIGTGTANGDGGNGKIVIRYLV